MTIKQQIERDLGFPITASSQQGIDYQCNACFALAKQQGKKPLDVAMEVAKNFKSKIATITAVPPAFLNIVVRDEALLKIDKIMLEPQKQRTVFFDYGCANIAKELHAGHLRSPIIGEALRRVHNAFGHKTLGCTYLGDWGLQIGLVIAQSQDEGIIKNGKFTKQITLDMLNDIYPKASKRKSTDQEFKKRAEDITLDMQNLKEPYISLWREIRRVSVDKIRESYDRLNCTFDFYNGESNAEPYVDVVLKMLSDKGLTYIDKDCVMMDVKTDTDTAPMPPVILKKGNGGDLYATSDVATAYYRYKNHKPNEIIYVSDFRQDLHFKQFFRIVKNGGLVPPETQLTFVGYGTMMGADGKPFKTRSGESIRLAEILQMVTDAASKRLTENGRGGDLVLAEKIGLSALKFADLSNNVRRDYIFEIDKFTSFEGKTGPYILYTIARINSIFEKANIKNNGFARLTPTRDYVKLNEIREIYVAILRLSDSYPVALQNYTLNGIVDAVYELAKAFNLFYANTNILKEPDPNKRAFYLHVCSLVKGALEFAMKTLAIDTVDKM